MKKMNINGISGPEVGYTEKFYKGELLQIMKIVAQKNYYKYFEGVQSRDKLIDKPARNIGHALNVENFQYNLETELKGP